MRFRGLDLNLLVVLDTLFDTRSVTRAGERLNLSQSATSAALSRLRQHFGDELLVARRNHAGIKEMVPTGFGMTLADPVRVLLAELQATVDRQATFDLATCTQHIRIIAPDYIEIAVLARAIRHAGKVAPHMSFEISNGGSNELALTELRRGASDFIIARPNHLEPGHPSLPLLRDVSVCIGCAANPLFLEPISREAFLSLRRIELNKVHSDRSSGHAPEPMEFLRSSNFQLRLDSLATLPAYLADSAMVSIVPRILAIYFQKSWPVAYAPVETLDQPTEFWIQWNRIYDNEPAKAWFRDLLVTMAKDIEQEALDAWA